MDQTCLERETGVEPATSTLARSRSTTELLPLDESIINKWAVCGNDLMAYHRTFDITIAWHWTPAFSGRVG